MSDLGIVYHDMDAICVGADQEPRSVAYYEGMVKPTGITSHPQSHLLLIT
jgi:hypothetical protein